MTQETTILSVMVNVPWISCDDLDSEGTMIKSVDICRYGSPVKKKISPGWSSIGKHLLGAHFAQSDQFSRLGSIFLATNIQSFQVLPPNQPS